MPRTCPRSLAAPLALALASAAQAQPLTLKATPDKLEEGRPTSVQLLFTNAGTAPLALRDLVVQLPDGSHQVVFGTRPVRATPLRPLADALLVARLEVSEAMRNMAVARAPMPPRQIATTGERWMSVRYLGPGESFNVVHTVVGDARAQRGTFRWSGWKLEGPALSQLYAPGPERTLSESFDGFAVSVQLAAYRPWDGKGTGVGLMSADRPTAPAASGGGPAPFEVAAAPFSLAAALKVVGAPPGGLRAALRLGDGRWLLQCGEMMWVVVGERGAPILALGDGTEAGHALAAGGRFDLMWYGFHAHPDLAKALEAGGFAHGGGKGMPLSVTPERLAAFIDLLKAHGASLVKRDLVFPPQPERSGDGVTATIDWRSFPHYPGAFLSLDGAKVVVVPAKDARQGAKLEADLWIEPRDPEIRPLAGEWEGMKHAGQDSEVALLERADFARLDRLPAGLGFSKDGLPRAKIRKGLVFLVRSSGGKTYKVLVVARERMSMTLRFAPLEP